MLYVSLVSFNCLWLLGGINHFYSACSNDYSNRILVSGNICKNIIA